MLFRSDGLRCVYHGIKFDVAGNCTDVPCIPQGTPEQMANVRKALKIKSYPCVERGDVVWTYMGPPELKPAFPDLEWANLPASHRFATRHVQECNWLQGLDGGFDPAHLSFLHSGAVDMRKGNTDHDRRVVPSLLETEETDSGFMFGAGRRLADGRSTWHVEIMILPFHKIIPSVPLAAHVWAPIDDHNTITYIIEAVETEGGQPGAVRTEELKVYAPGEYERVEDGWWGVASHDQDRMAQESQGVIVDRTQETLATSDRGVAMLRQMLFTGLEDIAAGRDPMGVVRDPAGSNVIVFDAQKNFTDIDKNHAGQTLART